MMKYINCVYKIKNKKESVIMLNIKEAASYSSPTGGVKRYFQALDQNGTKVLFSLREWESEKSKTLEEVKEAFASAEFPSYIKDVDYSYPLTLLSLTCFVFRNELTVNNMSLWEYETLIKHNKNAHPALKCAYIQHDDERELSVMCESYDNDSMTTTENIRVIMTHWHGVKHELMKLLNKDSDYIETLY